MNFTLYTKDNCGHCESAKQLLTSKGYEYQTFNCPRDVAKEDIQNKVELSGSDHVVKTVPQIFINDEYIGGFVELKRWMNEP